MKVAVIGGSGFIGYNLVLSLYEIDYSIVVVDKIVRKFNELQLTQYQISPTNDEEIERVFSTERPQVVYFLVTSNIDFQNPLNAYHYVTLDVMSLLSVLDKCVKYGIEKIIFVSSFDISYDDCSECVHRNRYSLPNLYLRGLNSFACEMYLQYYKDNYDLNYVSLRSSTVYGFKYFDDWQDNSIFTYIEKTLLGQPIVLEDNKESFANFLYIGDLVAALIHSLRKDVSGIYNVYNKYYSFSDLITKIEKYSGKKAKVEWGTRYKKMKNMEILSISSLSNYGWNPLVDLDAGIYSICKSLGIGK
jgi:UDP-glucose 4-epimerase